jgi:hypothetical protein
VDLEKAYAMYKRAANANFESAAKAAEKLEPKLSAAMKTAAEKLAANNSVVPGPTHGSANAKSW